MMGYNYAKLNGRIVEIFGTQAIFAEKMGLSERSISLKVNNKMDWSQSQIEKAIGVLAIERSEIPVYFFNK